MSKNKVTHKGSGRLSKTLSKSIEGVSSKVKIGLPKSTSGIKEEGGKSVLQIGLENEFGTSRIPARSFIKVPMQIKSNDIASASGKEYKKVVQGKSTIKKSLETLGIIGEAIIKDSFSSKGYGTWKENAELTKKIKGSSSPLVDTGTLRNSITSEVSDG